MAFYTGIDPGDAQHRPPLAGALFVPGMLAPVNLPSLKVDDMTWMVGDVTYRKDEQGTQLDVVLMPPQAFAVQPTLPPYAVAAEVAQLPNGLGRP